MSNLLFKDRNGQTPLPPELMKGLRHKHIQNMGELDEYEEKNIAEGLAWLQKSKEDCLTYIFWRKLHKKLFSDVWEWAGEIRKHELENLDFFGPHNIWSGFKQLEGDLKFWLEQSKMPFQEIAARFHERIETIHPFANGNGRFGRILIEHFCNFRKETIPTWGVAFKNDSQARRKKYIAALTEARRNGNYALLIKFMFS